MSVLLAACTTHAEVHPGEPAAPFEAPRAPSPWSGEADAAPSNVLDATVLGIGTLDAGLITADAAELGPTDAQLTADAAPSVVDAAVEAPRTLTLRYTPLNQFGTYSPHNAGAAWVEDAQGNFVKTLESFAFIRRSRLVKWNASSMGNTVDAVSSATAVSYHAHEVTWNMKGLDQQLVPDGDYTFYIEVTDHNGTPGAFTSFTIPKSDGPHTFVIPDAPYYADITVSYE